MEYKYKIGDEIDFSSTNMRESTIIGHGRITNIVDILQPPTCPTYKVILLCDLDKLKLSKGEEVFIQEWIITGLRREIRLEEGDRRLDLEL